MFDSIAVKADGDSKALCIEAGGPLDRNLLADQENGEWKVRLHKSKMATCKEGQFLLRCAGAKTKKRDNFAYVPFDLRGSDSEDAMEDDDSPDFLSTVLNISAFYRWEQKVPNQDPRIYRFAVGFMNELEAVGQPEHGFELHYHDGSRGARARKPSLLRKKQGAGSGPYLYAVSLDQIDCSLVSTYSENWFLPTLKLAHYG